MDHELVCKSTAHTCKSQPPARIKLKSAVSSAQPRNSQDCDPEFPEAKKTCHCNLCIFPGSAKLSSFKEAKNSMNSKP